MDRSVGVRTPESAEFRYDLAGLGSRFLAVAIDMALQVALAFGMLWGLSALVLPRVHDGRVDAVVRISRSLLLAVVIAMLFLIFAGYFIMFEAWWNGQTPGKKAMGLRVVRDGGNPADFASAAIRNLVRIGEMALGFYAVSAVATILSAQNKRLGDLAAGTLVVRDHRASSLETIVAAESGEQHAIALLSEEERTLIDRFVARRGALQPAHRGRMAKEIAGRVRSRVSADLQTLPDEALLVRLSAS